MRDETSSAHECAARALGSVGADAKDAFRSLGKARYDESRFVRQDAAKKDMKKTQQKRQQWRNGQ